MADTFSSQESDILPPEFKHLLTAEYAEIINTVQNEDDFEPVINEEDSTLHVKSLLLKEEQQYFGVSQLDNPPMMVVAPMQPMSSPTGVMPTTDEYPGPYDFEIQIDGRSSGKNWVFSYELYKLFINMNTSIHLGFKCEPVPHDLYVRALPVFCEAEAFQKPVVRCLHHRSLNDPQNEGFGDTLIDHILRIDHSQAIYECDETSGRQSVLVQLGQPQAGTDWVTVAFKFMCKNSCISGMNRRPIEVIFTLEDGSQTVLGRRKMKVRICSCPKRDKLKEEKDLKSKHDNKVPLGKRAAVPQTKEDNRSAKLRKVDGFIQLPVLDIEALIDVADYAQSRIHKNLRIEKRQATEEEEILLQNYKQILTTYE